MTKFYVCQNKNHFQMTVEYHSHLSNDRKYCVKKRYSSLLGFSFSFIYERLKNGGERRKCRLPASSPLPTIFQTIDET